MRNYLIMVEGAHDIAVLEKILNFRGVKGKLVILENYRKYGNTRSRQSFRLKREDLTELHRFSVFYIMKI